MSKHALYGEIAGGGSPLTLVQRSLGTFSSPTFGVATSVDNTVLVAWMSPNSTSLSTPPVAPAGFWLLHDTGFEPTLGKRHMYFLAQPGDVASMTDTGFANAGGWFGMAFEFVGNAPVTIAADAYATATSLTISTPSPYPSYALILSGSGSPSNVSSTSAQLITTDGGETPDAFWFVQPTTADPSYTFTQLVSAVIFLSMVLVQTPRGGKHALTPELTGGSATGGKHGLSSELPPPGPVGFWLHNGSSNHSLTTSYTWGGHTYSVTIAPGSYDGTVNVGTVQVTSSDGAGHVEWELSGSSSRYGRRDFTSPGQTVTLDAADTPAGTGPRYVWLVSLDGTSLDRWQFS